MSKNQPGRIIVYASSHGWGHNARLIPILDQLWEYPIEIASTAPEWLIVTSMKHKRKYPIKVRPLKTDPGCVQIDPFNIDVPRTIESWQEIFSKKDKILQEELGYLEAGAPVRLVISDISYFGVLVAEELKVPSVCIATFDWPFIYQNVSKEHPELAQIIDQVQEISKRFDYCLVPGTECEPLGIGKQKIHYNWLSRKPRLDRPTIRARLGLHLMQDSVLLSFGGHTLNKLDPSIWKRYEDIQFFVLVPEVDCQTAPAPNVHYLKNEEWSKYHTDLIDTVDVVFGKVGYGLVSEVAHCRRNFLIVDSNWNPEAAVLTKFIQSVVCTRKITQDEFLSGKWDYLRTLIEEQRDPEEFANVQVNGEEQIAAKIREILGDQPPKEPKETNYFLIIAVILLVVALLIRFFK